MLPRRPLTCSPGEQTCRCGCRLAASGAWQPGARGTGRDDLAVGPRPRRARMSVSRSASRRRRARQVGDARVLRDRCAARSARSRRFVERVVLERPAHERVGRDVREREHDRARRSSIATTSRVRSEIRPRFTLRRLGLEPVADAAHRVDAHRAVELLAHLRDVHVDRAGVAEPVVAPHAVEDLLAAQREPRALGEEAQQVELLRRERDRLRRATRTSRRPTSIVDVADLDDLGRLARRPRCGAAPPSRARRARPARTAWSRSRRRRARGRARGRPRCRGR